MAEASVKEGENRVVCRINGRVVARRDKTSKLLHFRGVALPTHDCCCLLLLLLLRRGSTRKRRAKIIERVCVMLCYVMLCLYADVAAEVAVKSLCGRGQKSGAEAEPRQAKGVTGRDGQRV